MIYKNLWMEKCWGKIRKREPTAKNHNSGRWNHNWVEANDGVEKIKGGWGWEIHMKKENQNTGNIGNRCSVDVYMTHKILWVLFQHDRVKILLGRARFCHRCWSFLPWLAVWDGVGQVCAVLSLIWIFQLLSNNNDVSHLSESWQMRSCQRPRHKQEKTRQLATNWKTAANWKRPRR